MSARNMERDRKIDKKDKINKMGERERERGVGANE